VLVVPGDLADAPGVRGPSSLAELADRGGDGGGAGTATDAVRFADRGACPGEHAATVAPTAGRERGTAGVVTVATAETPPLTTVAGAVGLAGTRHALVHEHAHMANVPVGQRLTQMAALLHRLAPGVRLM
jgi:hypothetical protein